MQGEGQRGCGFGGDGGEYWMVPTRDEMMLRPASDPDAMEVGARLLGEGAVVLTPTETVYALAVRADDAGALERLWRVRGGEARGALAWHAPTPERVREVVGVESPVHRRVLSRLLPGGVQLAIEMGEAQRDAVLARLGVERGVMDDEAGLLVRVTSHAAAAEMLGRCPFPVVMAGVGGVRAARTVEEAVGVLGERGAMLGGVVDAPVRPAGVGSTLVRLTEDGRYHVARAGLVEERTITRTMTRTILFVCTGNTCRSPMASAIARDLLKSDASGLDTRVLSAGIATGPGAPASPEAVEAMRKMGIALDSHASRPLTRELLTQADIVFAMTLSHRARILQLDPESAEKVHLLDPSDADVDDPFGQSQEVYDSTAKRMSALIRERMAQLDALDPKEHRP
ncbi:MAG: hypothetical protein EA380_00175 [Phycisphaeraceae bacterium]|nr:MAG: hypothetical protein EA380_00175 [Phycisphaeraceae bacterium]